MAENKDAQAALERLFAEVRACTLCAKHLPLGPRPVLRGAASARLLILSQAPGTRVHETGLSFNDRSGDRLRDWLGIDREVFYDESRVAIVPMGFCYPGRYPQGGDLPPRPECAPLWHARVLAAFPNLELTLLAGSYAIDHYLAPKPLVSGIMEGDVVELVAGPFKGEKARVQNIDEAKEEITVELFEAMVPIPVTVRGDHVRVLEKER